MQLHMQLLMMLLKFLSMLRNCILGFENIIFAFLLETMDNYDYDNNNGKDDDKAIPKRLRFACAALKMTREMNYFENQWDGQNLKTGSPETNVTSSCLTSENEIYARVTKPRANQESARVTETRVSSNLLARVVETGVLNDLLFKQRVPLLKLRQNSWTIIKIGKKWQAG